MAPSRVAAARLKRYGVSGNATERQWEKFDDRFDLAKEPNEINRFGWIVEIDPFDPKSTPKKRTALGRFKHEAANIRVAANGKVAAYMGDDEKFDYLYKFVSANTMAKGGDNSTLLDEGTLYVAKFTGNSPAAEIDGTSGWRRFTAIEWPLLAPATTVNVTLPVVCPWGMVMNVFDRV